MLFLRAQHTYITHKMWVQHTALQNTHTHTHNNKDIDGTLQKAEDGH